MHCVIVRGKMGTVVRRWASPAKLNGHEFTEAYLHPGDYLSIGSVELELISEPADAFVERIPHRSNRVSLHSLSSLANSKQPNYHREENFSRPLQAIQAESKRLEQSLLRQEGELTRLLKSNRVTQHAINLESHNGSQDGALLSELELVKQRFELAQQARLSAERALARFARMICEVQDSEPRVGGIPGKCSVDLAAGDFTVFPHDPSVRDRGIHPSDSSREALSSLPGRNGSEHGRSSVGEHAAESSLPVERKETEEMSEYLHRLLKRVNEFSKNTEEPSEE